MNNSDQISSSLTSSGFSEMFSLAVNNSSNIIFITDIDGNIEYVNKKFTETTGYLFSDIKGKNPRVLNSGKHDQDFYKNLWQTITSGQIWQGKILNKSKSGDLFWEHTVITPIMSESGDILNFLAEKEVITDKVRTEKALELSKLNFKNIFNSAPDTITIHDFSGKMLTVNKAFYERLGYTYEEAMNLKPEDFDVEETTEKFNERVKEITEKGFIVFETTTICKTGEKYYTEIISKIIEFEGQKAFLNYGRDITERKIAEQELERSERDYRLLTESLNDVVARVSKNGRLLYVSPRIRTFAGYEPEEELGKHVSKYVSKKTDLARALKILSNIFIKKNSGIFEFLYKPKSGKSFPVELSYSPVIENNIVQYVHLVLRDNTERKILEEDLKDAKEEAEAGANMKAAFLANMSHEIRTPMNGILGFTDLLKNPDLSKEKRINYIDIISKSGNHLLNLINDIIDVSKIDAGQVRILEEECKLNFCLLDLYNFFQGMVDKKNNGSVTLNVNYGIPVGEDSILTDETRLRQIITNLIGNAVKFTEKGKITVNSSINKDNNILISVEDTGIGMTKEEMSVIFERFRQADDSTTRNYGGTGLGLTISKAYVDMLGGEIWVESQKGKGSTFYFTIPYKKVKIKE